MVIVEMSDSQQQTQGLNRQYDQLGESLSDHQRELQFMLLGVTSFGEDFDRILSWLQSTEQQLNERDEDLDETRQVWKLFCCSCVRILIILAPRIIIVVLCCRRCPIISWFFNPFIPTFF